MTSPITSHVLDTALGRPAAPRAVPLAVSLNLSAVSIGLGLGAFVGGLALDRLGAGWLGAVGAVFAIVAVALLLANRRRFVVSLAPA